MGFNLFKKDKKLPEFIEVPISWFECNEIEKIKVFKYTDRNYNKLTMGHPNIWGTLKNGKLKFIGVNYYHFKDFIEENTFFDYNFYYESDVIKHVGNLILENKKFNNDFYNKKYIDGGLFIKDIETDVNLIEKYKGDIINVTFNGNDNKKVDHFILTLKNDERVKILDNRINTNFNKSKNTYPNIYFSEYSSGNIIWYIEMYKKIENYIEMKNEEQQNETI